MKAEAKVYVYAGTGAVLARDVEIALDQLGIPYSEIDEAVLSKKGSLKDGSVVVFPGGYTRQCVDGLGEHGFEHLREFVCSGGGYIGICAGAYMAAPTVEVQGNPPGLAIIDIGNQRGTGRTIRGITLVEPQHPLAAECDEEMSIWYQNGPIIQPGANVQVVAVYENGDAAIVCGTYGEGRVILFSPHPEGSVEEGINAEAIGTLRLLKNAIAFASVGSHVAR